MFKPGSLNCLSSATPDIGTYTGTHILFAIASRLRNLKMRIIHTLLNST